MQEYRSAVQLLMAVVEEGKSIDGLFRKSDSPLARQIVFGVIRDYFHLDAIVTSLVAKPLKGKSLPIHYLLMAGLYSVNELNRPAHASVNNLVSSTKALKLDWARGLVNGVMRNYLRNKDTIQQKLPLDDEIAFNHPDWLIQRLKSAWPDEWESILRANQTRAPMVLRVNAGKTTRDEYLNLLSSAGIAAEPGHLVESSVYLLAPIDVEELPGFPEGMVSVQDEASQLAAGLMDCGAQQTDSESQTRVLDCCAAPGGKACHLLETYSGIHLTAIDIEPARTQKIVENLNRLHLTATCLSTDLLSWQPDGLFDSILLDAPCSATGIIRRHPDIKLLRRESDIDNLVTTQLALLERAWLLLISGGRLVYSTCSVLPEENDAVIARFCTFHEDALVDKIAADWGQPLTYGRQLFPTPGRNDGFYYATLTKRSS